MADTLPPLAPISPERRFAGKVLQSSRKDVTRTINGETVQRMETRITLADDRGFVVYGRCWGAPPPGDIAPVVAPGDRATFTGLVFPGSYPDPFDHSLHVQYGDKLEVID